MNRTAANRLFHSATLITNSGGGRLLRFPNLRTVISSSLFSTTVDPQPFPNQTLNPPDSSMVSSSTSSSTSSTSGDGLRDKRKNTRAPYEEEQARVLPASLRHVVRLGWSAEVMVVGAKEVGVSPSIVGSFPRKEAALVEVCLMIAWCHVSLVHGNGLIKFNLKFFMDDYCGTNATNHSNSETISIRMKCRSLERM
ncbi:uncharacterized protein LOC110410408 [Herrania umbratica]|uniref:Ubiquinone biosynthesis protein n=1 Tax=Herrania umbratica TaxID=108875 RepID=A0A6J0ZLS0_9ROSI|nr:uncharacterized protein LOC110410408 [Herrania umbratica]